MKIVILMEDTCGDPSCSYEHGLSVYVETKKHKLLIDTGATDAFMHNAAKLSIDLTKVDTVILSHGHYDHAGGILSFYEQNKTARIYMQRSACGDHYHGERYIGIDKRIEKLDSVRMLDGDDRLDEELFLFSGITGREYFAESNLALSKRDGGETIPDDFAHEQCLVITQDGENTLISGCAHNGILNIISRYRQMFAQDPVQVISGFHMMKKDAYTNEEAETIKRTAQRLCGMETIFYTGHCTGDQAMQLMAPILGEKLVRIHSGMIVKKSIEI